MFKLNTTCLVIFTLLLSANFAKAQSWVPAYYYDVQGNKITGLIKTKPGGRSPVRDEAFIQFKSDKLGDKKISASELRSFVVGRDSFVVAAAPRSGAWSDKELDFVKVALDEPLKLYAFTGRTGGAPSASGVSIGVGGGIGGGGGGFGWGLGGGFMFPLGGGGGHVHTSYYFGANTAEMQELTPVNFADAMSQIMGDEPEVVNKIQDGEYNLGNINKLIDLFNATEAADTRPVAPPIPSTSN